MICLSLCDGMSIGQLALEQAGIPVEAYYAAEIKDIAINVAKKNYPNTIHIGDVNKISFKDGVLYTENGEYDVGKIDIVLMASPCQSFSQAMKAHMRIGLEDKIRSGLFLECYRILKEVNPTWFLQENVGGMKKEDSNFLSECMGVQPISINSKLVAPALRNRLYWTNIPNVTQPKDKDIKLQDILDDGWCDRDKARCLLVSDSRPLTTPVKMFHRYYSTGFSTLIFKSEEHYNECVKEYERLSGGKRKITAEELDDYDGNVFDGVRYMNANELAKCQTIPIGYMDGLTRNQVADLAGDGWTVDVIAHIFKGLTTQN